MKVIEVDITSGECDTSCPFCYDCILCELVGENIYDIKIVECPLLKESVLVMIASSDKPVEPESRN